jgi:tRNA/tmRNA/rRNA uracil-C5-methylase (TrmA/RlmC/RlmD family)
MGKAHIVLEIVLLLQGTPVYDFAQQNLAAQGDKVVVRCAQNYALDTVEGEACKIAMATAFRLYSYRFTQAQLDVLADLYATALEQLEPSAVPRVRARLCDPNSYEAQQDAAAALAACERLSMDF